MLGLAALAVGVSTCGGVTDSRESARDKATKATCDRYQTCGLIGSDAGDTYATYDSCSTVWTGQLGAGRGRSPPATAINQAELNVCLSAIAATDCTSFIDFLATLGKCSGGRRLRRAVDADATAASRAAGSDRRAERGQRLGEGRERRRDVGGGDDGLVARRQAQHRARHRDAVIVLGLDRAARGRPPAEPGDDEAVRPLLDRDAARGGARARWRRCGLTP